MKTLELYKVIFEAKDFDACEQWEKALEAFLKIRRNEGTQFPEPLPPKAL